MNNLFKHKQLGERKLRFSFTFDVVLKMLARFEFRLKLNFRTDKILVNESLLLLSIIKYRLLI